MAKFSEFDLHAIDTESLPEGDPDLKTFLSYNPRHHINLYEERGIEADIPFLYSTDREVLETDRSGWRHYDRIYSKHLGRFKTKKINLLEIGIEYGYGLLAWSRYFTKAQTYGMELLQKFEQEYSIIQTNFPEESSRIRFSTGANSTLEKDWASLFGELQFDVIIDDGAHSLSKQFATMLNAVKYLKNESLYFIEDIKLSGYKKTHTDEVFKAFVEVSKKCGFDMKVYRHVNPYRVQLLNMTESERIFHITQKVLKENPRTDTIKAIEVAKRSIKTDSGNHFNYMLAFSRGTS